MENLKNSIWSIRNSEDVEIGILKVPSDKLISDAKELALKEYGDECEWDYTEFLGLTE